MALTLAEQQELIEFKISAAGQNRDSFRDVIIRARKELDEFFKANGNVIEKEKRKKEWEEKQKNLTPIDPVWFEALRQKNAEDIDARTGQWWEFLEKGIPIPFAETRHRSFLPDDATMAHLVVSLGLFESVTQAKKAGKNGPLVLGEHRFKLPGGGIKRINLI